MWLSVDPLAMSEHNLSMSPYHFSSNNPIMRVDPDGLSDYFAEDGTYLGSDNSDMDDVRVMSQEVWNRYSTEDDQGVRSIDEGVGINGSKLASESGLSNDAQLGIYEHYNPTDLDLVAHGDPSRVGLTFSGKSDGSAVIKVKLEGNMRGKIIDHSSEIMSMYAHEKKHYSDFKELGFEEYQASSEDWREQRAYHAQVSDPSWSRTRANYRRAVLQGAEQYGYSPPTRNAICYLWQSRKLSTEFTGHRLVE
jgi:hypothetical protein